ncbi:MAG: signal peptidase [Thermoplasmata archaeon]|jgi:signal peptidase|nr:signal peptidase [Thermoplasmata archaeon]
MSERPSLARRAWSRAWRMGERYRFLRDVLGGILIVAVLAGTLAAATGGVWPPILVVESESMMHGGAEYHYGRLGSIDVGDIVFVRAVHDPATVHLWVDGGASRYGRPGDVITYAQDGDHLNTTIIHRAMTFITVVELPNGSVQYRVKWLDGQTRVFGSAGVYMPELGFDERFGFTPANAYRPAYSGFITKGDNSFTNPASDQALGISQIVDPAWVDGKAYGEVPWMGLAKLALQTGVTNPDVPGFYRVGNAFAPLDAWTCFFATLTLVIVVPLALDTLRLWRAGREGRAADKLARKMQRERRREAKAQASAQRRT